jgi:succinate-acetate transporter protein
MVFEWIMGNFFPMMVMGLFAVFWLSFGMLQLPTLGLATPYISAGDTTGAASPQYNAVIALYLIVWGFALFTFFFFTLKINTVFALIFLLVSIAAWVLSGAYWKVASGDYAMAGHLQKVITSINSIVWSKCADTLSGWRSTIICGSCFRLVHVLYHDGR